MLQIKQDSLNASVARGNAPNDLKSAGKDMVTKIKKHLQITDCGNNGDAIMRDTLSTLITEDMSIYQTLKNDIFG